MTLQQLTYFVAIQQYGGFIAAAEELYISQSSLSKSIMALEKELQVKLFLRNSRTTRLSGSGEQLLPYALEITKNYNRILDICENVSSQKEHQITLGGIPVLHTYKVMDAILRFERKHSTYQTDVIETTTREVFKGLSDYTLDLGIVLLKLPLEKEPEDLMIIPLLEDDEVVVGSADNPIMRSDKIRLEDLRDQIFIQNNKDADFAKYFTNEIKTVHPQAVVHLTGISSEAMNRYIIAKQWVSLSMKKIADNLFETEIETASVENGMKLSLCVVLNKKKPSKKGMMLSKFLRVYFSK